MLLICSVGLYLAVCELIEYQLVRRKAGEIFPPKLGWRLFRWFGIAACIDGIFVSVRPLSWTIFLYFGFLILWLRWPRTVLVDSACVSSCGLFGLMNHLIAWGDVSQVSSDWQEQKLRSGLDVLWTFTGYCVTVRGRDGSTIQHSIVNKDQGRFLNALRRFVPREAFDAGLYDWHPETASSSG
jgi:hypothetical protein